MTDDIHYLELAMALARQQWPPIARFFEECGIEHETVSSSLHRIFASGEDMADAGVLVAFLVRGHGFLPYHDTMDGTAKSPSAEMMAALHALIVGIFLGQSRRAHLPEETTRL